MKLAPALLALVAAACASAEADPAAPARPAPAAAAPDEAHAAMLDAGRPGPAHAELAKAVGSYQVDVRAWSGPGEPPVEARGVAHVEMILGGRYLRQTLKSELAGAAFTGELLMGFDNVTQRTWCLWIDDLSTGYCLMTGAEVRDDRTELEGVMRDARTPEGRPIRATIEVGADGASTWKTFDTLPDGKEFLAIELRYTRA